MTTLELRSFAKVNLHLEVLGRRDDGYHELRTVFQSVDLSDRLTLELLPAGKAGSVAPGGPNGRPGPGAVELSVPGGGAPEGAANLVHRAASRYLERWAPDARLRVTLRKRIPAGGGLGGGSSNAATTLVGLQQLLGAPAAADELEALARQLGADVPYFLVGGTAIGEGRGDRVAPLPELPETELCLAMPPVSISTAEVFRGLDAGALPRLTARSSEEPLADLFSTWPAGLQGRNDLEQIVLGRYPSVRAVYDALRDAGAAWVRLSGSGSTLFAWFERRPAELPSLLPRGSFTLRARTLSRSAYTSNRLIH